MGVLAAMLAERLGVPQLTFAAQGRGRRQRRSPIQRQTDYGYDTVEASLPAVVSVVEKINEPRYPSFKGIMAAKKKPVETLTLADAGIDAGRRRPGRGRVRGRQLREARRPGRPGTIVKDEGDGGIKAAGFLAERKFI